MKALKLILLIGLSIAPALLMAQAPRPSVVVIRGATVLTVTRGTIQNGTVILRDGKIAAVGGRETPVPAGADVVGASSRPASSTRTRTSPPIRLTRVGRR